MSVDSSQTDEALMLAFQRQGQANAFNLLYQRYQTQLYRYLLNRLGDHHNTDELFQDIWARIIKTRYEVKSNASFRTWLYTIARNRLIDHYRSNQIKLVEIEDSHPVDNAGPDEQLIQAENDNDILHAVRQLPREQQDVFLLKVESGMSLQEIADLSGEGFETIKSRYRYAIQKLGQLLDN